MRIGEIWRKCKSFRVAGPRAATRAEIAFIGTAEVALGETIEVMESEGEWGQSWGFQSAL